MILKEFLVRRCRGEGLNMYIAIYWSGLWGSGGCAMGGVKYGVFSGLAVVLAEFAFWGGGGLRGSGL